MRTGTQKKVPGNLPEMRSQLYKLSSTRGKPISDERSPAIRNIRRNFRLRTGTQKRVPGNLPVMRLQLYKLSSTRGRPISDERSPAIRNIRGNFRLRTGTQKQVPGNLPVIFMGLLKKDAMFSTRSFVQPPSTAMSPVIRSIRGNFRLRTGTQKKVPGNLPVMPRQDSKLR